MAKTNKLTMNTVKKQYKKAHEKADYELKDGFNLTFSPIFPHKMIVELMEHMATQFKYAEENGKKLSDEFIYDYMLFLCVKYFTHLKSEISDEFEQQLDQMEWLIDTGYLKEIAQEVFLPVEIQKVFDKAVEINSRFLFLENLTKQMETSAQNLEFRNKDVIADLGNKDVQ